MGGQPVARGGYVPPRLAAPAPRLARGQGDDAAPPPPPARPAAQAAPEAVPLSLPSPTELGLRPVPPAGDNWTASLSRLEQLGLAAFQAQELPQGGWKFVCQMRTSDPSRRHRIESGPAPSKAAAIQLALAEVERWVRR